MKTREYRHSSCHRDQVPNRREAFRRAVMLVRTGTMLLCLGFASRSAAKGAEPVATCTSEAGTIIIREAGQMTWHAAKTGDQFTGGEMLVGFPGATLDSQN